MTPPGSDQMTGNWNLDVMLKNGAWSIESDLEQIAKNAGYQAEDPSDADTYVAPGVNWGYTGAQLSSQMDPVTLLFIVGILLLILLTGYLIIYNVFQISAAGGHPVLRPVKNHRNHAGDSCGGSCASRRWRFPCAAFLWAFSWAGFWAEPSHPWSWRSWTAWCLWFR